MIVMFLLSGAFVALCFSAFFSGSETAFLSVSRERILHMAREGGVRAKRIQKALSDMSWTTTTLLIGNNIANVSYSAATAALSVHLFSQNEIASVVWGCFAAFIILYTSEFIPKLLCSARPLRRSLLLSGPFSVISILLSPITYIAIKVTNFFIPSKKTRDRLTVRDLVRILEDRKDGVCLSDVESALITKIIILRSKGKKITVESLLDALRD